MRGLYKKRERWCGGVGGAFFFFLGNGKVKKILWDIQKYTKV